MRAEEEEEEEEEREGVNVSLAAVRDGHASHGRAGGAGTRVARWPRRRVAGQKGKDAVGGKDTGTGWWAGGAGLAHQSFERNAMINNRMAQQFMMSLYLSLCGMILQVQRRGGAP